MKRLLKTVLLTVLLIGADGMMSYGQSQLYLLYDIWEYDSLRSRYAGYSLAENGDTITVNYFEPDGFTPKDTMFGFYPNGRVACYRIYKKEMQHGNFEIYDSLGNTLYSGSLYNGMRIGTWYTYTRSGKVIDEVIYKYKLSDSLQVNTLLDSMPFVYQHLTYDTLTLFRSGTGYGVMIQEGSVAVVDHVRVKRRKGRTDDHKIYGDGIVREKK